MLKYAHLNLKHITVGLQHLHSWKRCRFNMENGLWSQTKTSESITDAVFSLLTSPDGIVVLEV